VAHLEKMSRVYPYAKMGPEKHITASRERAFDFFFKILSLAASYNFFLPVDTKEIGVAHV
jgi:hypothetical protein